MTIIPASNAHVDTIVQMMNVRHERLNELLGFPRYKTDSGTIVKVVSARISHPKSPYRYLVMADKEGQVCGFVAVKLTQTAGTVVALELAPECDSVQNAHRLLLAVVAMLRRIGVPNIMASISRDELNFKKAYDMLGARYYLQSGVVGI